MGVTEAKTATDKHTRLLEPELRADLEIDSLPSQTCNSSLPVPQFCAHF